MPLIHHSKVLPSPFAKQLINAINPPLKRVGGETQAIVSPISQTLSRFE